MQEKPRPTEQPAAARETVRERALGLVSLERHTRSEMGRLRVDLPPGCGRLLPIRKTDVTIEIVVQRDRTSCKGGKNQAQWMADCLEMNREDL